MGAQTSLKAGVRSGSKKMANSRHGFNPHPSNTAVAGAFGKEDRERQGKGIKTTPGRTRNLDKAALQEPPIKGGA